MNSYRIDSHKLIFHPERTAQWLDSREDWEKAKSVYPIYMEISPTGACNHRCSFCALDFVGYKPRALSIDIMKDRLWEMGELGIKSIMYAGEGEPLLYKEIIRLTQSTALAGIDAAFTTNGVLLNREFIENCLEYVTWIKTSIDAGTSRTYSKIHGADPADFDRVVNNLKKAVAYRNRNRLKCTLGAQMLLLPKNINEIETLAKTCRDDIGLDYLVLKPYSHQELSLNKENKDIDYNDIYTRLHDLPDLNIPGFKLIIRKEAISRYAEENRGYDMCRATPFFWSYIMSTGDVTGCSAFFSDDRFKFGNINDSSFQEIWEGDKRRQLFSQLKSGFDISVCRKNCRMNMINLYLNDLINPSSHVNFI